MALHVSATHPSTPVAGQIYYGSANITGPPAYNEKHIRYYDGAAWQELATRAYVDAQIGGISSYSGWLMNTANDGTTPTPYTVASGNKIAFLAGTDIGIVMSNPGGWASRVLTFSHSTYSAPTATSTDSSSHISAITVSNGHVTAINTVSRSVRWDSSTTVTNNIPYWNGTTGILNRTGYSVVSTITDPGGTQALATEQAIVNYVKLHVHGLSGKSSVRAASTANINLASPGTAIFDGVTLTLNQRILVKNQNTASQNGIYLFKGTSTAMVRAEDTSTWPELVSAYVFIEEGTTLKETGWLCTIDQGGTIEVTAITWVKFFHFGTATVVTHPSATGTALIQGVESGETRLRSIKPTNNLVGITLSETPFADIIVSVNEENLTLSNMIGPLIAIKGGTGVNSYAKGNILFANAAITSPAVTPLTKLAIGAQGSILRVSSSDLPEWSTLVASGLLSSVTHTKFNVTITTGVAAIAPFTSRTAGKFYYHATNNPSNTTAIDTLSYDGHFKVMNFDAYGAAGITGALTASSSLAVTGTSTLTGKVSFGTIDAIGVIGTPASWNLLLVNYSGGGPWEMRRISVADLIQGGNASEHYVETISGTSGSVSIETHGCGTDPIVLLREASGSNFLDVYGDIYVNDEGDVTWSVAEAMPANSKIIIMGAKIVRS